MEKKTRVGILFGGQSAEHEISLQSARSIIENIDYNKYEVVPIGINKEGSWYFLSVAHFLELFESERLPVFEKGVSRELPSQAVFFSPCVLKQGLDVVFPILHGPYGEDGTVQGLLRLARLPFVGSDVLGSAVCMDKGIMKRLLKEAGFPTARFHSFHASDPIGTQTIVKALGLPLFVKPANMGSSVGINKVYQEEELAGAVHEAFRFDERIVIEEFIEGREIECSVLGGINPIASLPGEVIPQHDFYSYEAKYLDEQGALFTLPALLDAEKTREVQELAIQAFKSLQCEGMARVDFFLKKDGKLFINELNTIPGFTTISLYPKLWELSGIAYSELIDRLIEQAMESYERKRSVKNRGLNSYA